MKSTMQKKKLKKQKNNCGILRQEKHSKGVPLC